MNKKGRRKPSNQIVGNAGLYYVCYELSNRGWSELPTSRNAKGINIIIFSEKPEIFVAKVDKLKNNGLIHEVVKNPKKSYWLQTKEYKKFKDNLDVIGGRYD